jgi:hypothetical protein
MRRRPKGRAEARDRGSHADDLAGPPDLHVPDPQRLRLLASGDRSRHRSEHEVDIRAGQISKKHSSRANIGRVIKQAPKASSKKRPNGFKVRLTLGK